MDGLAPGSTGRRSRRAGRVRFTHHSFWWGWDGINLAEVQLRGHADLAIGRLEPFEIGIVSDFPTIKDPASLRPATSLCRLGYPFHQLQTDCDEETGQFLLPDGALPAPLFPVEGMFTRQIRVQGPPEAWFIETSSPGLRGQSGGPVFDVDGRVWGIQSRTHHLDLVFSPKAASPSGETVEHQFLNVGIATHPSELLDLAAEKGVRVRVG